MLTAKQIEAARFWAHSLADPEIDRDLEARGVIDGCLTAYERVAALLACVEAEQSAQNTPTGLMFIEPLRRALEGD